MRIQVRLPRVEPDHYERPKQCPYEGCDGRQFKAHGIKGEAKPLRDPHCKMVTAYRWRCLRCGQTYPCLPVGCEP